MVPRIPVGVLTLLATLLATADEMELAGIFREYADERRAMRLSREIVRRRGNRPFVTSDDLVGAIRGAFVEAGAAASAGSSGRSSSRRAANSRIRTMPAMVGCRRRS